MTELEKCELAKSKGFTYCPVSGEIRGIYGKVITKKDSEGYAIVQLYHQNKCFYIFGHRLGWYLYYGHLPSNSIDHIDGNSSNNEINNLRDITHQQNMWNQTKAKGYCWIQKRRKFKAHITIDKIKKTIGYFHTEQEARNAYLKAKETYHIINA